MQLHFLSISKLKMQQRHKRKIQNIPPRISKQSASNLKHMNQQFAEKNEHIDETKVKIQQMRLHVENLVPLPPSIQISLLQQQSLN